MTKIQWDLPGERIYEGGVDRGVLYDSSGRGFGWNGLIEVAEDDTTTVAPVYFDSIKFNDIVTVGEFTGSLTAYTYPDEFLPYDGVQQDQTGVFLANQRQDRFSICYRTMIGNDLNDFSLGYKIHLVYNLTAKPGGRTRATLALEDLEALEFEWKVTSIPEDVAGYHPTSHFIIDSRRIDPWLLQDIEDILYGDEDSDATLPPLQGFITFIRKWNRLIITDNGDGTWTAEAKDPAVITMTSDTEFLITADTILYHDEYTYDIWSSEKNEEDITPWRQ
jgi:hypothetical protein